MNRRVIDLVPQPQTCDGCGAVPAPYVPVVFLLNGESFKLPQSLCEACTKTIRRDRVLTPPVIDAAVTSLYDVFGTSDLQLLDHRYWRLAHIENDTIYKAAPDVL